MGKMTENDVNTLQDYFPDRINGEFGRTGDFLQETDNEENPSKKKQLLNKTIRQYKVTLNIVDKWKKFIQKKLSEVI